MAPKDSMATDEAQIRELIDDWAGAVRANDIDGIMSHYAPDKLAFDAIAQLQFKGAAAYRKHWQACLSMCQGMTFEIHDLDVTTGDSVAFCHALNRCGGTGDGGEEKVCWMRMTVCYRKVNGMWMIVHEHFSSPLMCRAARRCSTSSRSTSRRRRPHPLAFDGLPLPSGPAGEGESQRDKKSSPAGTIGRGALR